MARFVREGECNKCGSCCGGNGVSPWPANFPMGYHTWQESDLVNNYARLLTKLAGFRTKEDGTVEARTKSGSVSLKDDAARNVVIRLKVDGGVRKVDAHGQDVGAECPLLGGVTGDAVRPCQLEKLPEEMELARHDAIKCWGQIHTEVTPPMVIEDSEVREGEDIRKESWAEAEVAQWFALHPDCSYRYVEGKG